VNDVRVNNLQDGMAIGEQIDHAFSPINSSCIARVTPEGKLLGGAIYSEYTGLGGSAHIHAMIADRRCLTRPFLYLVFSYPFDQMLVKKLFAPVRRSKEDVFDFCFRLGFKPEAGVTDVFPGDDMILMSMYRADCKFLGHQ
jgi:hypothetical protein